MIKKLIVRRRPRTGLGKMKRVLEGVVYLAPEHVSKNVVVMSLGAYYDLCNDNSRMKRAIGKIRGLVK